MSDKITSLAQLRQAALAAKGLIAEVAGAAAEAIEAVTPDVWIKPITQAAYNELSDEEKNSESIVYLIIDADSAEGAAYVFSGQFETETKGDGTHVSIKCASNLDDDESLPVSLGAVKSLVGGIEAQLAEI